jgi:hypothetical protein
VSCPLPASSVAQRQEIATHKISQLDWTYKMGLRPVFASREKPSCWMDMMVAKKHHPFAISLVKASRGLSCHAVMCYAVLCRSAQSTMLPALKRSRHAITSFRAVLSCYAVLCSPAGYTGLPALLLS